MSEEILLLEPEQEVANALADLPARRVATPDQIRETVSRNRHDLLWIARSTDKLGPLLAVFAEAKPSKRRLGRQSLLVLEALSAVQRTLFPELFRHVLAPAEDIRLLAVDELVEVLGASRRADYLVGIAVDRTNGLVLLYRGNLETLLVPFSWFEASNGGTRPDFSDFGLVEYGQAVHFGSYEAATSAILCDFDPDYRKRAKEREIGLNDSLGGSIRRLRLLRGLRQSDFPGISAKEVGRIERGEVEKPHPGTIKTIADRLGVSIGDLRTY